MATQKKKPVKQKTKSVAQLNFEAKTEMMDVADLHINKKNPRTIKRRELDRLKKQIEKNPKMAKLRPIIHDDGKILGGNQRFRAMVELGWTKVPAINASKLTETEKKNFILWDNENPGEWDLKELSTWPDLFNINLPLKETEDYTDANAEMPIVPVFDEKYRAVLIVVKTEMDFANIATLLNLGKARDYKKARVGQTQVISFEDFMKRMEAWKKSK